MKFSMTGQENRDLLIQGPTWAGFTVSVFPFLESSYLFLTVGMYTSGYIT
jgi:hypothetical protein